MPVISLSLPYIPLIQKPKCCAAACLQMILYRNGFGLRDQEDIAIALGVKIGTDDKAAFKLGMPVMTKFNFDEGISTLGSVSKINEILREFAPSLRSEGLLYSKMKSVEEIISEEITLNHDIWVEYHSQEIHVENPINDHLHDGLIESFDTDKGLVTLIDPSPRRRQRKIVRIETVERAISDTFGRETGFVVVRRL